LFKQKHNLKYTTKIKIPSFPEVFGCPGSRDGEEEGVRNCLQLDGEDAG